MSAIWRSIWSHLQDGLRSTPDLAVDNLEVESSRSKARGRELEVESAFSEDEPTDRIDGIVALIMAIGRAMVAQEEPQPEYSMFFV